MIRKYLFDAFASVITPKQAVYVAGPLASGPIFYNLQAPSDVFSEDVRGENEKRLRAFVAELRGKLRFPVIDPSIIRVSEWSDFELGIFFTEVIERFVGEVWYLDGWEFSRGATKEFQFCVARGVMCKNQLGEVLLPEDGMRLISGAAEKIRSLGLDDSRFRSRLTGIAARSFDP